MLNFAFGRHVKMSGAGRSERGGERQGRAGKRKKGPQGLRN